MTVVRRSTTKRKRSAKILIFGGICLLTNLTKNGVRCFATGNNDKYHLQHHLNHNHHTSSKRRRQENIASTNLYHSQSLANLNLIQHTNRHNDDESNNSFRSSYSKLHATSAPQMTDESDDSTGRTLEQGLWPCMDKMDKDLIKISLPVIGNYAIGPLIGAVDLFWVNRMGNALAVAGQAAANQVFSSAFWFVSFLPSVTATLVAKKHAKGDQEATQDAICQALFVGFFIAMVGTPLMFFKSDGALSSVLSKGAPAMEYAKPYLMIRALAFLPSLISLVGFSAFRGILDTKTPVKISAFANVFNALLDPILIFTLAMGTPHLKSS